MADYAEDIKLTTFQQNIGDLARANRFIATFTGSGAGSIPDNLRYFVKTAHLPGRTIGDLPAIQWFGLQDKRAGDPSYEDITMEFHNDVDFTVKKWIEEWMESIVKGVENTRLTKLDYSAQIKLEQLGQGSKTIATYLLYGCYPKAMTAVDLGSESADATTALSITFNVDYWTGGPDNQKAVGVFA